ncbi:4-hydroxy-tetrahydrodipicolinate synthase/4-hydroxy-2-oxoglutarate aldolase [Haladaptatus litoreus]|uniref:4-hydroxy-tetrahydrodipicolinate synthase/4-hydroxy-2-oxoglutarate aldolase n=1 Tax=Haladaptatus litoreus TaxID=553468 RepID=A0A1N7BAK0_9EURY|nr:dihydrodipicolinate synthase family protein [Haladaptatus litoreus]SIR48336.1 4-hydroxy-tetrahydrodipicolinate synthase/4-hydroxy-2-oxoglutarate aldolase [Haladaptatus litoreus]
MHGTGVPLLTPFDDEGNLREADLRELVAWVEDRGVDFIVPCGSNSEAELMSVEERNRVTEIVADEASVPVLAGTGHPGLRETLRQTNLAAEAGADAALVVTPFYFGHGDDTLADYYRTVAEESPIPVYLYSVPVFTDVVLSPEVVGELADHENIAGMKDSSGNLTRLQRERARTEDADFDLLVGSGSIFAAGLDAGADGGILGLANVAPERASEIYRLHQGGHDAQARQLNAKLVELNQAITAEYGVPGAKAAMQARGAPAGAPRRPHRPVSDEVRGELAELVQAAEQ